MILAIRLEDDALQRLIAPSTDPPTKRPALGILGLTAATHQNVATRTRLVTLWTTFRAERHALNDDLGLVPLDDWPTFLGQFTAKIQPPPPTQPNRPNEPARIPDDPPARIAPVTPPAPPPPGGVDSPR